MGKQVGGQLGGTNKSVIDGVLAFGLCTSGGKYSVENIIGGSTLHLI